MLDKKWLLHPWTLLAATVVGILGGYFFKNQVGYIEIIGTLFMAAISMCILPLIAFSMVSSFAKTVRSDEEAQFLRYFLFVAFSAIIITGAIGALTALSSKTFGLISEDSKIFVGNLLIAEDINKSPLVSPQDLDVNKNPLAEFAHHIIAPNILQKIVEGNYLPLLFFSCLLGMSLGLLKQSAASTIKSIDDLYYAVVNIIDGLMYLLPFALIAIFSNYIAKYGFPVIISVAKMLLLLFIVATAIFILQMYLIARAYKRSIFQVINDVKQPLIIGLTTSSSLAAFPSMTHVLEERFKVSKNIVELATPLSLFLNQQGTTLLAAFVAVLMAGLFGIPLNLELIIAIIFAAVLFAIAASGTPFIAVIALFAIALSPLGIPIEHVFVLLVIIFLIADPIITAVNVSSNMTVGTLLSQYFKKKGKVCFSQQNKINPIT